MPPTPSFPVYIPSKGRADIARTPATLDRLGVPYRIIVEDHQHDAYAANYGESKLLVLPQRFLDNYDTFDRLGYAKSKGPGAARNFAWEHSIEEGWPWHWVMDDNLYYFGRLDHNRRLRVGDGAIFHAMETFALRYRNLAMCGPQYWMFAPNRAHSTPPHPFIPNTRIFSCNLIRNDVPQRWRGRYNEDTGLSLDLLKAGWCTVLFTAFLQYKPRTSTLKGGNTEDFYAKDGTQAKSELLVRMHPDCCRLTYKFQRAHHNCSFSKWRKRPLVLRPGVELPAPGSDPLYGEAVVVNPRPKPQKAARRKRPSSGNAETSPVSSGDA